MESFKESVIRFAKVFARYSFLFLKELARITLKLLVDLSTPKPTTKERATLRGPQGPAGIVNAYFGFYSPGPCAYCGKRIRDLVGNCVMLHLLDDSTIKGTIISEDDSTIVLSVFDRKIFDCRRHIISKYDILRVAQAFDCEIFCG